MSKYVDSRKDDKGNYLYQKTEDFEYMHIFINGRYVGMVTGTDAEFWTSATDVTTIVSGNEIDVRIKGI